MTVARVSQAGFLVARSAVAKARVSQTGFLVIRKIGSPRGLTIAQVDNLKSGVLKRPRIFVRLEVDSGDELLWSGIGDKIFETRTYLGVSTLGSISAVQEAPDQQDYAIQMKLSGIDPTDIATFRIGDLRGRRATVWLVLLNVEDVVIGGVIIFRGSMDTAEITIGEESTIVVTAVSPLADWAIPAERRYTNENQKERFPNDRGLEFVAETTERRIVWGGKVAGGQGGGATSAGETTQTGGSGGGVTIINPRTGGDGDGFGTGGGPGSV